MPYYTDDLVTLYHGDAIHLQPWLEADALITDPPYGMDYTGFGGRNGEPRRESGRLRVAGDMSPVDRDAALILWGDDKPALVFGRWNVPRPDRTRMRLIWDKSPCGFMGDLSLPWGAAEEEIYVLGSGFIGKREGNVIRAQTLMSNDKARPDHPTPKPIGLMEVLIAKTVGVIADPFAGSGATLIAARNLGRKSIGVEMEEKYCELIAKRLQQQTFDFGAIA
ncbi:site-specific DNA-methyltransferase [Cryobacterium arcticum]|uniref:site-specific DNA-methyltransferase n=1 Tax=Cryobacterium arcticum TaxID=670052 RepID=UPI001AD826F2|nr:site-specific DNA-methyltransferase [Cryobacterium arcticum]